MNDTEKVDHQWPTDNDHVWGPWMTKSRTEYYRSCIHPYCNGVEYREAPRA